MASLHNLLDEKVMDIAEMKKLLETDSSSINELNDLGKTPLERVISFDNCSADIVEMFLNYGANPNSPLRTAIRLHRDENILRVLLQKRADASPTRIRGFVYENHLTNYLDEYRENCTVGIVELFIQNVADPYMNDYMIGDSLCSALRFGNSVDVIITLINACISSLNRCNGHGSVLHCATDKPTSGLNDEVLQLLLQKGADVSRVDRSGQSLLCFAIPRAKRASDIKLLLEAGASLNACTKHSPLVCATDRDGTMLSGDMVKLLVDEGACVGVVNDEGLSPLELALKNCRYEMEAIELLCNLQIKDSGCAGWTKTVLYLALSNPHCKFSALKFLVNNGACLDSVSLFGETLMHVAVATDIDSGSSVIRFLLRLGVPVDEKNASGVTPLELAVENESDLSVLKMLLATGARINRSFSAYTVFDLDDDGYPFLLYFSDTLILLVKYALLENPEIDICNLLQGREYQFVDKCLSEVQKMESKTLEDGRSFREFLNEFHFPHAIVDNPHVEVNYSDLNLLLRLLIADEYPHYFDVISAKIGRTAMEMKLQELKVYAVKCRDSADIEEVILDYKSVNDINQFLSDDDLLRLILVFYVDHHDE